MPEPTDPQHSSADHRDPDPVEADERPAGTDASLNKLDEKLSTALGDLSRRNRKVEEYLDFLTQERQRELRRSDSNQLTLDDLDVNAVEPGDAPTAPSP